MSLGPIMLDLEGPELCAEEREILRHPAVGGVILFSRNYRDPAQLARLVADIHAAREPRLLTAVDHEGGRVQRFREGFTALPPAACYGRVHDADPARALALAESGGWLMAAELRAAGVDFSFAPVLDLDRGNSKVIGDRAFHRDPQTVAELARAWVRGMRRAGMAAVGKHFPGHGGVEADSHLELPVDERPVDAIRNEDLLAFERMVHYGLPALMPAHVVYPAVDSQPAGFSARWLKGVLRGELDFQGAIFSDDIGMAGAAVAGDLPARARAARAAGCDMVLVCNDRAGAVAVLERLGEPDDPLSRARLVPMHGRRAVDWRALAKSPDYRAAVRAVAALVDAPELDLGDDSPA